MSFRGTATDDVVVQSAVLTLILEVHPDLLTLSELVKEMAGGEPSDFAERDAVERAVRDLAGSGLLHCNSDLVLPTRAAVRFHRLEID